MASCLAFNFVSSSVIVSAWPLSAVRLWRKPSPSMPVFVAISRTLRNPSPSSWNPPYWAHHKTISYRDSLFVIYIIHLSKNRLFPWTIVHTNKICFHNQFIFNLNNKCHRCPLYSCQRGLFASRIWCPPWWTSSLRSPQIYNINKFLVHRGWPKMIYHSRFNHKYQNHVQMAVSLSVQKMMLHNSII